MIVISFTICKHFTNTPLTSISASVAVPVHYFTLTLSINSFTEFLRYVMDRNTGTTGLHSLHLWGILLQIVVDPNLKFLVVETRL